MSSSPAQFLNPSEAAKRLGVSAKALRLYEQRGLITPIRTAAGWRAYGPEQMARATEIAALRTLGLSLGQVARVLGGDAQGLEPALAAHQATLEGGSDNSPTPWKRSAGCAATLLGAKRRPPENWRACWERPPSPSWHLTFPGRGAANGSSCATSALSTTLSARWAAARHGLPSASPKPSLMPPS